MNMVRGLVSKKKKRFVNNTHGFNLDLSYIPTGTPVEAQAEGNEGVEQLIAMGFPSEGGEAMYRNPMREVRRFFNTFHQSHFKVYNLCSERAYDIIKLFVEDGGDIPTDRCARYGFDDHNPPPLALIQPFCEDLERWLEADARNVASIHCKAGKGRTGTMIAAYLVHTGRYTAEQALQEFGDARTQNGKGVTIPSQKRFVHYYEQYRLRGGHVAMPTYQITHVRFVTVPTFDGALVGYGCDPYFTVSRQSLEQGKDERSGELVCKLEQLYDYSDFAQVRHFKKDERFVDLDCSGHRLFVSGDIKLSFFDKDQYTKDKMFHIWFNTAFIENNYLCFEKSVVDKACKDKENKVFDPNFKLEIFLHKVSEGEIAAAGSQDSKKLSKAGGAGGARRGGAAVGEAGDGGKEGGAPRGGGEAKGE
jgi:phosphatidylinositol-3,4,5-trisphosphate 3-phosphatase/dual-specificity protein phosphatase PTEN